MITPMHDRFLVRRDPPPDLTKGGIVIPESIKWRGDRGKVLAVGPGKKLDDGSRLPMSVKVGDTVMLPEYGGVEVNHDGELLSLMTEDEILGVLEDVGTIHDA